MFFKGTERRPTARDIAGEIDAIGGEFNAFTGKEYTAYYVKCAAEHRDIALDVLVDMLRNSRFDEEEIDREKGVIIEEMNMYFDTPRDFIGGVYEKLLYGDQPLGGTSSAKETVRNATRRHFMDYLGRWYKPSRMVAGDPEHHARRLVPPTEIIHERVARCVSNRFLTADDVPPERLVAVDELLVHTADVVARRVEVHVHLFDDHALLPLDLLGRRTASSATCPRARRARRPGAPPRTSRSTPCTPCR